MNSTQPMSFTEKCRTVALVGAADSVHERLAAVVDSDVVLIESVTHAYTTIKRTRPDLVLLCLSGDCFEGCRVLSMLALDRDTAHIPVVACMTDEPEMDEPAESDEGEGAWS